MSEHDNDTCPHLVRASLLESENAKLKAEVERLRKAGDAMADWIDNVQHDDYGWPFSDAWNAAKKGKPTK